MPTGYGVVALGIARGALDAFVKLAGAKAPRGGQALLRDSPVVQDQYGQAEAALRAGRAFLFETTREIWEESGQADDSTTERQTLLRLAGAHATAVAAQAVDIVWKLAAGSAIFAGSPLERRFRDIHVATQNVSLSHTQYATMGGLLLGAEPPPAARSV